MIAEVMIFNELGANSEIGKEFRVENRSSVSAVLTTKCGNWDCAK